MRHKIDDIFHAVEILWQSNMTINLKKELMDILIWKITESYGGKYNTKYRSEGALEIKAVKKLHHEHVFTRKEIKKGLVSAKSEGELRDIFSKVEACVVTREEHKKLDHKLKGWKRYKEAGIKVFDVSADKPKLTKLGK
jgi:hypothetical protein